MFFFIAANKIIASAMGNINPLIAPPNISSATGLPTIKNTIVLNSIKAIVNALLLFLTEKLIVFKNETVVKAEPTTEVMAALQKIKPKSR